MNPMIRKELRQRMRERRAWLLPTLYLVALGGAVALAYYEVTSNSGNGQLQGAEIGVAVFYTVVFTQMALLLLMAPVFSAGSVTIEKEQRTLGGLLTSLLTPLQVWWGKYVAALLFLVLLLVCSLPVLSLSFSLGGIGPRDVGKATGVTFLVLASISAIGLYCSSFFRRSVHSTAVCYGVVIALTVLTFVAFLILASRWESTQIALGKPHDEPPRSIMATLYLNPFFSIVAVFLEPRQKGVQDWVLSLGCFALVGALAGMLAIRNLRRSGEQV